MDKKDIILYLIDFQNDFVLEEGALPVKGAMLEKMICISLGIPVVSLSSFLKGYPIYRYTTTRLDIR